MARTMADDQDGESACYGIEDNPEQRHVLNIAQVVRPRPSSSTGCEIEPHHCSEIESQ
jgi:hypothetical protein